ncbi:hypothetical protein CI238_09832 [Colletotrichum incanum]|uniref:Uncharacterized protein n=1 Tax=Colletotrichum incanum TaxID=1573173 RepID=A0A167BA24_COLIC|nr:hypothetical protein CI238_09832 [Colletotrichum incanum]
MATFQPIEMAIAKPEARFIRDHEMRRTPRHDLLSIARYDESHNYPYCWGFTIFRTIYTPGSDEAFAKAIDRLAIYAKQYADDEILHKRLTRVFASQSIDNILAMPENPRTGLREDPYIFDRWVKVVTNEQWADRGREGVRGFVWSLWFVAQDPDFMYEEAGWADESDGFLNLWGMLNRHS